MLPEMDKRDALARAEQLRKAVERTPVVWGHSMIGITASFGVAAFPGDGLDADQLVASADSALYAAKLAGRNGVRGADRTTRAGHPRRPPAA